MLVIDIIILCGLFTAAEFSYPMEIPLPLVNSRGSGVYTVLKKEQDFNDLCSPWVIDYLLGGEL